MNQAEVNALDLHRRTAVAIPIYTLRKLRPVGPLQYINPNLAASIYDPKIPRQLDKGVLNVPFSLHSP